MSKTKENLLPQHIAIIMDGNRRWAKNRGRSSGFGHRAGYRQFVNIAEACRKKGVRILTVYAFSTENWKRAKDEVDSLMNLLRTAIKKETARTHKDNIRIKILGRKEDLPEDVKQSMIDAEEKTKNNTGGQLNIALSYGGRAEIIDAIKHLINTGKKAAEVTENLVSELLYTTGQPEPDLIIRCGGVSRLSNFLLWQSAYSELYFSDSLWPDFNEEELERALDFYARTKRNFGK